MINSHCGSRLLLGIGALVGAALAVSQLAHPPRSLEIGDDVVAGVDGRPILRADYRRALAAVAADRRSGHANAADRQRVLDRLIDQELLVQHGLELGLAQRDPLIRSILSNAVIELLSSRADPPEDSPDDDALRSFYRQNADWFRSPARVRIDSLFFRVLDGDLDEEVRRRAVEATRRIEDGESFAELSGEADSPDVALPVGLVSIRQIRDAFSPTVARTVADAPEGEVAGPVRSGDGYHVLRVAESAEGGLPDFESIREVVRFELERTADERRLRLDSSSNRDPLSLLVASTNCSKRPETNPDLQRPPLVEVSSAAGEALFCRLACRPFGAPPPDWRSTRRPSEIAASIS